MENTNTQETDNVLVRLPLWKNCLDEMLEEGVTHGKVYPTEYFEQALRTKRDTMEFGLAVSEIRRGLEEHGFYLSGRGQKGAQYVVVPPEANRDVMAQYQRAAIDVIKRAFILGMNTRTDLLSAEDKAKHERQMERIANRRALLARAESIASVVKTHSPKLLTQQTA